MLSQCFFFPVRNYLDIWRVSQSETLQVSRERILRILFLILPMLKSKCPISCLGSGFDILLHIFFIYSHTHIYIHIYIYIYSHYMCIYIYIFTIHIYIYVKYNLSSVSIPVSRKVASIQCPSRFILSDFSVGSRESPGTCDQLTIRGSHTDTCIISYNHTYRYRYIISG